VDFFRFTAPSWIPYNFRLEHKFQIGSLQPYRNIQEIIKNPHIMKSLGVSAQDLQTEIAATYGDDANFESYFVVEIKKWNFAWSREVFGAPTVAVIAKILSRENVEIERRSSLVIDLRSAEDFAKEAIPGATSIAMSTSKISLGFFDIYDTLSRFVANPALLEAVPRNRPIILYGYGEANTAPFSVARYLYKNGVRNLSIYRGGYDDWLGKSHQALGEIPGVQAIAARDLIAVPSALRVFVDARSLTEFQEMHLHNAVHLDKAVLDSILNHYAQVPLSTADSSFATKLENSARSYEFVVYGINEYDQRVLSVIEALRHLGANRLRWLKGGVQGVELAIEIMSRKQLTSFVDATPVFYLGKSTQSQLKQGGVAKPEVFQGGQRAVDELAFE